MNIDRILVNLENSLTEAFNRGTTYATKDMPDSVKKALRQVGYKRSTISVIPATEVSPSYAGGAGRRGFFVAFDLATGNIKVHEVGSWGGSNMFNPTNRVDLDQKMYPIPLNAGVIQGSEGETVFADLYIHPENLAKLVTAGEKLDLTKEELGILAAARLRSMPYKADEIGRVNPKYHEYDSKSRGYKLSAEGLKAIELLRKKGLIKPGFFSLTVDGDNALNNSGFSRY